LPTPQQLIRRVVASLPEDLRAFGNNETDTGEGTILHYDRFEIPVYSEIAKGAAFNGIQLELDHEEIPRVNEYVMCKQVQVGDRGRFKALAWTYLEWWENANKIYGVFRRDGSSEQFIGQPYAGILELSADWPTEIWDNGVVHYTTDGGEFQLRELSNGLFVPCRRDPRISIQMLPEAYENRPFAFSS
jgi:hypothetical protein